MEDASRSRGGRRRSSATCRRQKPVRRRRAHEPARQNLTAPLLPAMSLLMASGTRTNREPEKKPEHTHASLADDRPIPHHALPPARASGLDRPAPSLRTSPAAPSNNRSHAAGTTHLVLRALALSDKGSRGAMHSPQVRPPRSAAPAATRQEVRASRDPRVVAP